MAGLVDITFRGDGGLVLVMYKPGDCTCLELVHSDELSSLPLKRTEPAEAFPSFPDVAGPRVVDVDVEWTEESQCFH